MYELPFQIVNLKESTRLAEEMKAKIRSFEG